MTADAAVPAVRWNHRPWDEPDCPLDCRCPQCAWEHVQGEVYSFLSTLIDREEPAWPYSMMTASVAAKAAADVIANHVVEALDAEVRHDG